MHQHHHMARGLLCPEVIVDHPGVRGVDIRVTEAHGVEAVGRLLQLLLHQLQGLIALLLYVMCATSLDT